MTAFLTATYFKTEMLNKLNSADWHVLNFAGHIEHSQNTIFMGYARGWCSKKKEKIFLSVDPFKEKKTN